jgi:hypothetical protein
MTINRASIYPMLRQGLNGIMGYYKDAPDKWKQVFKTKSVDQAYIYNVEYRGKAMAQRKAEGDGMAQDSMSVKYQSTSQPDTYGLKVPITFEALDDNQYKSQFPRLLDELRSSLSAAKKQNAANVFNLGGITQTMDNVPLFSIAHPLENGATCSNLDNVALSDTALKNAMIAIRKFKKLSGTLIQVEPVQLYISPENENAAAILLGSQFKTSIGSVTDNAFAGVNDMNQFYGTGFLPKGYIVDNYITSPTFAAIITDADDGLIHYSRQEVKTDSWMDKDTRSIWFSAWERYKFEAVNWRSVYCLNQ